MEKILPIIEQLEKLSKELNKEVNDLNKDNLELLEKSKNKLKWDEDLLKEWHEEYWHIYPAGENEYFIAIPKFIPFSIGWLDHSTKGYNVFKINQYTQWLGELPEFLRKELNLREPEKIFVSDNNIIFDEGKEEEIKERYGDMLSSVSKGTARIKIGKEFDLYGKRLHGLVEKGFKINLRPMVTGSFQIKKTEVTKKSNKKGKLYSEIINELFDEGFFVAERKFEEVIASLQIRGVPISPQIRTGAYGKLNNMTKSKKLYKVKKESGYYFIQR